jgi:hypothetical protein
MLYAEICPKVRRHNARPSPSGRALCLLTLGLILAYNMDNTIVLYKYEFSFNSSSMIVIITLNVFGDLKK